MLFAEAVTYRMLQRAQFILDAVKEAGVIENLHNLKKV
jgi:hypothetical protein